MSALGLVTFHHRVPAGVAFAAGGRIVGDSEIWSIGLRFIGLPEDRNRWAEIAFLADSAPASRLVHGTRIEILEGTRIVATAWIVNRQHHVAKSHRVSPTGNHAVSG